ncbi:ferrous iron transporter B [Hydrogenophaga sp. A37]|uniref:ferrous iron transporter B n=1 Tax=Hydrogenophaga sp. A37 TaxID=1945864 RepID=UPI000985C219|nr:ferrous iron transporter B [Hydrogenophaga sp. A37]OOG79065.1 ferrous iron transporter B [Hydrogenophaga sp. A37]
MDTAVPQMALLGNPNCGKTALFNLLTGTHQKVANYAGVTVERKAGWFVTPQGRRAQLQDLPGTYSLVPLSHDEAVTRDVVMGRREGEVRPDLLVCVVDATHLQLNLRLVLEAQALGLPMVLVLNMFDVARSQGMQIHTDRLARRLNMPVVTAVSVHKDGAHDLLRQLDELLSKGLKAGTPVAPPAGEADPAALNRRVRELLVDALEVPAQRWALSDRIDRWAMHPFWGYVLLAGLLLLMFQAVFAWAAWPMETIEAGMGWVGREVSSHMADGPLRSLLVDGVIAGAGGVLVFLPQILILFFFIFLLEDSGYLPRAAFLMDRVMGTVGLSGRSFIPLLSSFACAVPGIMATRTISHWRDRWLTILVAPLMTCSARLPVYALLIAAFIPQRQVAGLFNLQGLVLFGLYVAGILSAMAVAFIVSRRHGDQPTPLLMELPAYRWPSARNVARGLWERAHIFVRRVGGIILALMVLLWFLSSYPAPPEGFTGAAVEASVAGRLGHWLAPLFAPLGFDWRIVVALTPAMAAREVVVAALGTVYALSVPGDQVADALGSVIAGQWSMATALSLMVWFIYAPQCVAMLAAVRREAGGMRHVAIVAGYLFALAYVAAWFTYRLASQWGAA